MAGAGGVDMEQFEAYFQRADLDRDGRISGAEAVTFFQGSNLPKEVLAQIWMHADRNRIGYLSRPEFYNALKLVTVAQSKRELTPEIVKAALFGPASAKIPAPRINIPATPVPQSKPVASVPSPQVGVPPLQSSQNFGLRGQAPSSASVNQQFGQAPLTAGMNPQFGLTPSNQQFRQVRPGMSMPLGQAQPSSTSLNQPGGQLQSSSTGNQQFVQAPSSTNMNQQFFPAQSNPSTRPPLSMPTAAVTHPPQGAGSANISTGGSMLGSGLPSSNNDWLGGKTGAASSGPVSQVLNRGTSSSVPPFAPNLTSAFSATNTKDPKVIVGSVNGSMTEPMFGGDVFSGNQSSPLQVSSTQQHSVSSIPSTSISQPSMKLDPFEALQSTLTKPSTGGQAPQTPSLPKPSQQVPAGMTSSDLSPGIPASVGTSTSELSQIPWPKMTRAHIQKYLKVFLEVDTDRDGRVTGEQARNLFFSWRLPREVLKQVWDLSDQDNDSALTLREFCIALYLMERYREGRTLPPTLPNSIMLDENLLSLAGPPTGFGGSGWGPSAGLRPPQGLPGAQPVGLRPPVQPMYSHADGSTQTNQQNARGPVTDNFHANEPSNGEENSFDSKDRMSKENDEKIANKEDVLLDSKEKLIFYRNKMQDLVLYKSRCDNRLNEITERARADKGESELLEKKYQEKYKLVAEIHSKLTLEEASFREIQARKMELQQAIVRMEQGGSADGILQVRADRIQSDLEELLKALANHSKNFDVQTKSSALIELPPGWQPGIPEVAEIWDEDWDKFEDEGFSFDVTAPADEKSESIHRENSSPTRSLSPESVPNGDATPEKLFNVEASAFETRSVFSAEESKSLQGSPGGQAYDSPTQESSENHFRKSSDGDAETHRSFEETTWGNFDNNEDIDSVWGFNAKASFFGCALSYFESDNGRQEEKYFFGSNDFGASPDKTDSPKLNSSFQNNSLYTFEELVPGTSVSRAGNSPSRYSIESKDPFVDNFSRYDSFSMQDADPSPSPSRKNLTRFDSVSSMGGFDHSRDFSFDDSDPFASSGPFKVSSETTKKDSEKWGGY
ncbi:hypothetical protein F511_29201 [Dorcoceras hygrometricum]|uniref:Epidermal growth factor receptor substrate 15-like 1 n=1 Tax=Dorcoceras hygrometricum TaxID=472368 RepID=A0A2Z7C2X4_9LAMI|nr:hypothetical protein F511_29201 [Dorcoceras hygrometricum]